MVKEYKQIDKGPMESSIVQDTLYYADKKIAIETFNLIKDKKNGKLRERHVHISVEKKST